MTNIKRVAEKAKNHKVLYPFRVQGWKGKGSTAKAGLISDELVPPWLLHARVLACLDPSDRLTALLLKWPLSKRSTVLCTSQRGLVTLEYSILGQRDQLFFLEKGLFLPLRMPLIHVVLGWSTNPDKSYFSTLKTFSFSSSLLTLERWGEEKNEKLACFLFRHPFSHHHISNPSLLQPEKSTWTASNLSTGQNPCIFLHQPVIPSWVPLKTMLTTMQIGCTLQGAREYLVNEWKGKYPFKKDNQSCNVSPNHINTSLWYLIVARPLRVPVEVPGKSLSEHSRARPASC